MKNEHDLSRVAPLTAGAAPAGSTAASHEAPSPLTHTPGPWTVDAISDEAREIFETDALFWVSGGPVDEVIATISRTRDGSALADAHLIAAAPDQHAALKAVRDEIRRRCSQYALDIVDAAIAKAEEGR